MRTFALFCLTLLATPRAHAQQAVDLHISYATATTSNTVSLGAGAALETLLDLVPGIDVAATVGADYQRERALGAPRTSVSLDATIQPERQTTGLVPYAGGSVSANWSGGERSEFRGRRMGLDAIVGLKFSFLGSELVATRIEQRFGYVRGTEHRLTTRLGLIVGI